MKLIATIGTSSSGKSTWAEEFVKNNTDWVEINRDYTRFHLFTNGIRDWTRYKFNKSNEKEVTEFNLALAEGAINKGQNIIISDTNLNPSIRSEWESFAKQNKYEYEEKLFPCDWKTLVKRNAQREGGLSETLLWSQYLRYQQQFSGIQMYEEDLSLPDTVIVDIDGTIASMEGIRKPFEWSKVSEDGVRWEILHSVEGLASKVNHITFLSGRDSVCRKETEQWLYKYLNDHEYVWDLYMRAEGDNRKDDIVKDELYEKYIRSKYNVVAVFDDRLQMIRHWTVKRMPNIIQVGKYNDEF